ncbi:hypothetical protein HF086_009756 [Spodoptera exigua]|uniref:Peptidase M14 domain-containing protein n=1 Tax=Spodoptera exigua TaxID=7107 RepID=A0A922MBI0_SPOEX|nr:hypothetical protein HF086_009756 [Spodoptera exigua]
MKWFVLILILTVAFAKHEMYKGWKSYYIGVSSVDQSKALGPLIQKFELDFLSHPAEGREGVVLVKPQHQAAFVQELEAEGIAYRIHADDIEDYLDYIGETYPDVAKVVTGGHSFNNHPIKYVKISTTNFEDETKPIIVIDGTIHAREWITPPTATWAIHKLVENVTEPDLLERFDWILVPVINPDGSFDTHPLSLICRGVDANRNFDFVFNTVGTDWSPCGETYPGTHAFSQPETRVIRDILHENLARIALYINLHSFGSMIMYPWGHDGSLPQNALGLHTVGIAMANAIQNKALPHFPKYVVGNSGLIVQYFSSGAASDYAHYIGVPFSYAFELPGLEQSYAGFHLDPKYIGQVCQETWEGFVVGARRAGDLFPNKK